MEDDWVLVHLLESSAVRENTESAQQQTCGERPEIAGNATWQPVACSPLKLWYRQAASNWIEALPIGNGRIGGMVFGGIDTETIELNEDTLWSSPPKNWNNPEANEVLPAVRKFVLSENYAEATELSRKMLGTYAQVYEPLGTLSLSFSSSSKLDRVEKYVRQLDLSTGVVSTAFVRKTETGNTIGILREAFVSYPDQVLAIRISTDCVKEQGLFQLPLHSTVR